jgi:hypothetical protein
MKCLKCGADAPPNLNSSLCPAYLEAQKSENGTGCLFLFLFLIGGGIVLGSLVSYLGFWRFLLWLFVAVIVLSVCGGIWMAIQTKNDPKVLALREPKVRAFGSLSPRMVCPHCQTKGTVRAKTIQRKAGISGGKATAAALTGGISLLATGLSRKERVTQAHCDNCGSTWKF